MCMRILNTLTQVSFSVLQEHNRILVPHISVQPDSSIHIYIYIYINPCRQLDRRVVGSGLAFTRDSFLYSGIVHWSILFLAFNTSFITTPPRCCLQSISRNYGFPPPPCFAIHHNYISNGNIVQRPSPGAPSMGHANHLPAEHRAVRQIVYIYIYIYVLRQIN